MKHFRNIVMNLLFLVLMWISISHVATTPISVSDLGPECLKICGNVEISYPFGLEHEHCAVDSNFLLRCNDSNLIMGKNVNVSSMSLENGTISARIYAAVDCYDSTDGPQYSLHQRISLGNGPFTFSAKWNKFTAIGCDTIAVMSDADENFASTCGSSCRTPPMKTGECSGIGCCQTSVPQNFRTLNYSVSSTRSHLEILDFNPCGYAFLADMRTFNAASYGLAYNNASVSPDVAIEWVIGNKTCNEAQSNISSYACGDKADCFYSNDGKGYRCSCKKGFIGNPYFADGCKDINECNEPDKYKCEGKCKNTVGDYTCSCSFGMLGNGEISCQFPTTIFVVSAGVILMVIIGLLIFIMLKRRRKEKNFLQNGGLLLTHQRIRLFSEAELAKATKNYDTSHFVGEGGFGKVYRGILENNIQVAVKKPKGVDKGQVNQQSQQEQEIAIVSQVNHKNVVKLLGLCIETTIPLLVYELISNGTLSQHIHGKISNILQTWKARLRVASETALALDYLHSLADPPIIHSDIKSANILLDDNYAAKVSDFGASVLISTDESIMATKIQGTLGYLDPEYLMTGILTAKSDVYSFGILLLELLTGVNPCSSSRSKENGNIVHYFRSSLKSKNLFSILDFQVIDNDEREEIQVVAALAKRCIASSGIRRPTMKEVAEELVGLRKLRIDIAMQQNSDETEYLLGESSSFSFSEIASADMKKRDTYTMSTLDIESYGYNF